MESGKTKPTTTSHSQSTSIKRDPELKAVECCMSMRRMPYGTFIEKTSKIIQKKKKKKNKQTHIYRLHRDGTKDFC